MTARDEQLKRIESSSEALVRAAIKDIDKMIRNGMSLEEILKRLRIFRLSSGESIKLRRALEKAMDAITASRADVVKELSNADILTVKAATKLSFPKFKTAVQDELIRSVQKAIASESGVQALTHELRQKEFSHAKTLAQTSLAQYNNELTIATAEVTGTNKFLWSGPAPIITSHKLCKKNTGKVFTLAELDKMDNGCGLPVRNSLGGFGCRHQLIAVPEE